MNVDSAEGIGNAIIDSMVGVSVENHKFKKNNQVNIFATAVCLYISVDDAKVDIERKQLYQRLRVAGIG